MNILTALTFPILGIGMTWVAMIIAKGQLEPQLLNPFYNAVPSFYVRLFIMMITLQFIGVLILITGLNVSPRLASFSAIFAGAICPLLAGMYLDGKHFNLPIAIGFTIVMAGLVCVNYGLEKQ